MHKRSWTGAAVLLAGATLAATAAAPAAPVASWNECGPRITFLVWPHGHPALPLIGFPRIRNPHVEAYLDFGSRWPEARAGAYVLGGTPPGWIPQGDVLGPCLNYGDATVTGREPVAGGVTIARQTAVECTFTSTGVFDIVDRPGKVEVLVLHAGNRVLARAVATPTSASVTVPRGRCRDVRSPGKPPS